MKRLGVIAVGAILLLPNVSIAQPDRNRPDQPAGPSDQGQNRPNRPGGAVTQPGKPPRPGDNGGRPDQSRPGNNTRPPDRPTAVRPPARPNRPQFSWHGRSFNPIRGGIFRYPPGYAYRRWSIGALLPALFLTSTYYYDGWRTLGIDPPPPGRRWVRYGSDLLLVNVRTRRIEDVITGVFY